MPWTGAFRAGKSSRAIVSGVTVAAQEYGVNQRGGDLDTTNFESLGYEEGLIGIKALDWSLNCHWNAAQNPDENPPGLYPRDDGALFQLYVNVTDANFWNMPLWRCINSKGSSSASGLVEFDSSGKSQGIFYTPSGSVSTLST